MEIVKLRSLCDKLNLNIAFGDENDKLFFADSAVLSCSTAFNALKGTMQSLKGFSVIVSRLDESCLKTLNTPNILEQLCTCELLILHEDCTVLADVLPFAAKHKMRVCTHNKSDAEAAYDLSIYIEGKLNSVQIVHGVLLDVFGIGVMLVGDSGTGKSETALELVAKGHLLVADDAVALRREGNSLIGCSPALTRHLMDIRGIGIIDVRAMYGAGAVRIEQELELVINMEPFDENKDYREREVFSLNGVSVPMITLPTATGRNMAVLTEVAARIFRLNAIGHNAEKELKRRMNSRN